MIRKTQCACGQVSAVVTGDPVKTFICHCDYCQRRTGSVMQVSCYYPHDRVLQLKGETKVFSQSANSIGIQYEFCPNCGTTVHWTYGPAMEAAYPGMSKFRGFAVGCFVDRDFSAPTVDHERKYAHRWVPEFPGIPAFDEFAPLELAMPRGD